MFKKLEAKIGMKMHLRSSRYYAKDIKKLYKKIKKNMDKKAEIGQLLAQSIKDKSISRVHASVIEYADGLTKQFNELNEVLKDVYVLENKIEEHLQKTIQDLEKLKHKEEIWNKPEIKGAFEELHDLMGTIRSTIKEERWKIKKLKKDSPTLRNRSALPDEWVLKDFKRYSKKEKKEIKQSDKLLDKIEELIKDAQNEKLDEKKLKEFAKTFPKLKKILEEEFQGFLKLIKAAVVLLERTKEGIDHLQGVTISELRKSKFPEFALKSIDKKIEEFKEKVKKEETMDFKRTQVLKKMAA